MITCCDSFRGDGEANEQTSLAKFGLEIKQKSEVYKNKEALFKIYLSNDAYGINFAYIDCDYNQISDVTYNDGIVGCNKRLHLDNDTVKIYLTPEYIGKQEFRPITLVVSDDDRVYLGDTTFYYTVKEK